MMRSTLLKDYDHDKDIEKFSGDEPDAAMKFLEHDINGQDNAEANYGVIGVAIHRGTDPVVTAANLNAEATKLHRFINIAQGSKAGDAAWNNADFWTPSYQNAFRLHSLEQHPTCEHLPLWMICHQSSKDTLITSPPIRRIGPSFASGAW